MAADYLLGQGYEIVRQNWRRGYYEIDIVARKEGKIVFIEVKSKRTSIVGLAEDNLSSSKLKKIKKAAERYLSLNNNYTQEIRFDAITIDFELNKKMANIKHFKNII